MWLAQHRGLLFGLLVVLLLGIGSGAAGVARLGLDLALLQCLHDAGGPAGVCQRVPDNSDERARYHRGVNALHAGFPGQAITLLTDYVAADPEDRAALLYLGLAYWQEGDKAAAMSAWREAEAAPYFLHRGLAGYNPADIETAIAIGPATPEMYFALGEVYRGLGQSSDATAAYEKFLAGSSPQEVNYWLVMGYVRLGSGALREALQAFQTAAALQPDMLVPHYRVAETAAQLGNYALALEAYQTILRLAPGEEFAYLGAGEVYLALGDISSAVRILEQADRKFPHSGRASAGLGALYLQQTDAETAIHYLKEAVRRDPTVVWMRVRLAEALMQHGDRLEAARVYRESLALAPDDAMIKQKLAELETQP